MTIGRKPVFDADVVRQTLNTFTFGLFEIRCLKAKIQGEYRPVNLAGWFDNIESAVEALKSIEYASGIYFIFNEVTDAIKARSYNRLLPGASSTGDEHITRRQWLLIDCDADRISGISATNDEKNCSYELAESVRAWLAEQGWPEPVLCDSGNGYHLMYRIVEPTESDVVQRVLQCLDSRFSFAGAGVDTSVFNPARITKLYGTLACKGDDIDARPHRMSNIIEEPDYLEHVPSDLLTAVANMAPVSGHTPQAASQSPSGAFDVRSFLRDHNVEVLRESDYKGGTRFHLATCVWNADHTDKSAIVIQHSDGRLAASCSHNSCTGNGWKDFRETVDPGCYDRRPTPGEFARNQFSDDEVITRHNIVKFPSAEIDSHEVFRNLRYEIDNKIHPTVFDTGFDIELIPGQMIVLGGEPGAGKSTFLLQCLFEALERDDTLSAVISSVELSPGVILEKQLARMAAVSATKIRYRELDSGQNIEAAYDRLERLMSRVHFVPPPYTLGDVRQLIDQHEAKVVLIDYLQRHKPDRGFTGDARRQCSDVMDGLRTLCHDGAAILVASALNRVSSYSGKKAESVDPHMGMFRESSEIEYGVDDAYFLEVQGDTDRRLVHLKSRYSKLQDVPLVFCGWKATFEPEPIPSFDSGLESGDGVVFEDCTSGVL